MRPEAARRFALPALIVLLSLILRVVALDSDAYAKLCWSGGLLTDEGFYIHNARNRVLFGQERANDFNNALIMPALHYVQVAVFSLFGVGAVVARMISVGCSLLTLWLFWSALRRLFGARCAWVGAALLGLDHVFVLYNRMALMDTPAALALTAAFWAFTRAVVGGDPERSNKPGSRPGTPFDVWWMSGCGALLALSYATRGLAALAFFSPLGALWMPDGHKGERGKVTLALLLGLGAVLFVYGLLWYLPNREELQRLNAYYIQQWLLPRSGSHLIQNLLRALFGDSRGMSPYLARHTPITFALALVVSLWWFREGCKREPRPAGAVMQYLVFWLWTAWIGLAVVSYSPSRYYILFYPAMAALAAVAVERLDEIGSFLARNRMVAASLSAFFVYHTGLAFTHHRELFADVVLFSLVGVAFVVVFIRLRRRVTEAGPRIGSGGSARTVLLTLWLTIQAGWTADWLTHLRYAQRDTDRWLAANLPADTVLLGDIAPGVSLNNRFITVPVLWGLCNDVEPVERFAGRPRAVIILDGRWKEPLWIRHYPNLTRPERRIASAFIVNWEIGVYRVEGGSPR